MSKTLIVGPSWVGDAVMAQSLYKAIKQKQPEAQISVLTPVWSLPILSRMPEVESAIEMSVGHGAVQLGVRRKIARELQQQNFDQAFVLPGSFKSALVPWLARIPKRTGFVGEQRYGLLNDIRKLDQDHLPLNVQRYVALAYDKNENYDGSFINPLLVSNQIDKTQVMARLSLTEDKPALALCPGAEFGSAKQWPAKHFAAVANAVLAKGWQVWILGSEKDSGVAAEINQLCREDCDDLTGRTSLADAVDLLASARTVVTNDSGLMHVASAVGSQVIALYGSSTDAFTPPLSDKAHALSLSLACRPCFQRTCPLQHLDCLEKLTPERVLPLIFSNVS